MHQLFEPGIPGTQEMGWYFGLVCGMRGPEEVQSLTKTKMRSYLSSTLSRLLIHLIPNSKTRRSKMSSEGLFSVSSSVLLVN